MHHHDDFSFCDHEEALAEAVRDRDRLVRTLDRSLYPAFHICAPAGWINDPNGLCFFNGRYHAFYQHNPMDCVWGPMYWGHVSSPDLVHWTDEPMALAPSIEADREGVWSGSCVTGPDGRLYAFYTGHRWLTTSAERGAHRELQCLAVSSDGVHFEKLGVVVDNPQGLRNFRDPKVFMHEGAWYMVVGQESADHRGQVALYRSGDLMDWEHTGILYECPEESVYMLECPDLFELGGAWVLVFSKMYVRDGAPVPENHAGYVVGTWVPGEPFEVKRDFSPLDSGHAYYAPTSFETPDGRRVGFGWVRPRYPKPPEQAHGWCGQLTLPRAYALADDLTLVQLPVAEVTTLFGEARHIAPFPASMMEGQASVLPEDASLKAITVTIDAKASSADAELTLTLDDGKAEQPLALTWAKRTGRVEVDRGSLGHGGDRLRSVEATGDTVSIQLFLDRCVLETYVDGGRAVMTELVYPTGSTLMATLACTGGTVVVEDVTMAGPAEDVWQDR